MKTVLITGAGRGIGAALAVEMAKLGHNIAINYNASGDEAEQVAKNCQLSTVNCQLLQCDIRDFSAVQAMIAEIGRVDILVNNAGIALQKLFVDTEEAEWDNIFAVNTKGAFNCTRAVLPQMLARGDGQIINISSKHGINPAACEVAYSASKAALIAMTDGLAKELAGTDIKISHIALPGVDTDMQKKLEQDYRQMTGFGYTDEKKRLTPTEAAQMIIELEIRS
ncbi:MAG: SDR family oxidoreductase [Oscillospiraceae bacterium]|nr:SDR family oxidoreductase [Oscillospiraceae bacterium]